MEKIIGSFHMDIDGIGCFDWYVDQDTVRIQSI